VPKVVSAALQLHGFALRRQAGRMLCAKPKLQNVKHGVFFRYHIGVSVIARQAARQLELETMMQ
jgi:hypothetical protein